MILHATREQEQAVREMCKPGVWKQEIWPPLPEMGITHVKVKNYGPHGESPWWYVMPDGTVRRSQFFERKA